MRIFLYALALAVLVLATNLPPELELVMSAPFLYRWDSLRASWQGPGPEPSGQGSGKALHQLSPGQILERQRRLQAQAGTSTPESRLLEDMARRVQRMSGNVRPKGALEVLVPE